MSTLATFSSSFSNLDILESKGVKISNTVGQGVLESHSFLYYPERPVFMWVNATHVSLSGSKCPECLQGIPGHRGGPRCPLNQGRP